jgi:hypothetical protein
MFNVYLRSFKTLECLACQHIDVFLFSEFIQILGQGHMAYARLTCTPRKSIMQFFIWYGNASLGIHDRLPYNIWLWPYFHGWTIFSKSGRFSLSNIGSLAPIVFEIWMYSQISQNHWIMKIRSRSKLMILADILDSDACRFVKMYYCLPDFLLFCTYINKTSDTWGTAVKFSKDEGIFVSLATNSCRTRLFKRFIRWIKLIH